MDVSTCVVPYNLSISILFERVLPSLVTGLLFGGIPPNILHVSNLKSSKFEKGKIDLVKVKSFILDYWSVNNSFNFKWNIQSLAKYYKIKYTGIGGNDMDELLGNALILN